MVTALIIASLSLAAATIAIYRRQRMPRDKEARWTIPPEGSHGLFGEVDAQDTGPEAPGRADTKLVGPERRVSLLQRASQGDTSTLREAHESQDPALYADVLDALVAWASGRSENLELLVSEIVNSKQLRANTRLAERLIEETRLSPDNRSTARMLHIAALSDDVATYQKAVDQAIYSWREAGAPHWSAEELQRLVESEYWVIAPAVRSSGAGFALRSRLAGIRRELAAAISDR